MKPLKWEKPPASTSGTVMFEGGLYSPVFWASFGKPTRKAVIIHDVGHEDLTGQVSWIGFCYPDLDGDPVSIRDADVEVVKREVEEAIRQATACER